jgi:hypothetical protein
MSNQGVWSAASQTQGAVGSAVKGRSVASGGSLVSGVASASGGSLVSGARSGIEISGGASGASSTDVTFVGRRVARRSAAYPVNVTAPARATRTPKKWPEAAGIREKETQLTPVKRKTFRIPFIFSCVGRLC